MGTLRRALVVPWLVATGCRGLLGIDDPTLANDAQANDAASDAAICGTADWDQDGRPDDCDPCPMFGDDVLDHDTDGDGIGDGCDPEPTSAGEHRALWVGFHALGDVSTWTTTTGTWAISGGKLVQSDSTVNGRIDVPGTWANVYLMTEIEPMLQGTMPSVGFCTNVGTITYRCCDVDAPVTPEVLSWSETSSVSSSFNGSLATGERIGLTNLARATKHTCTATQANVSPAIAKLDQDAMAGKIVLHTRQQAAAYRYLFVVQTLP